MYTHRCICINTRIYIYIYIYALSLVLSQHMIIMYYPITRFGTAEGVARLAPRFSRGTSALGGSPNVYIYIYMCMYIYIYIYTHVYIYI